VAGPDGVAGRFDQVIGTGFVIVSTADLSPVLTEATRASLRRIGARVVRLADPAAPSAAPGQDQTGQVSQQEQVNKQDQVAVDVDGYYRRWLRAAGYQVIVVRPDFYFFGAAADAARTPDLLRDLFAQLGMAAEPEPVSG
jgi:flavoprotein hydroxylase